jgi:hypothetical protein
MAASGYRPASLNKDSTMTMLTHTRGVFERAAYLPVSRHPARTAAAKAQLAAVKRFCLCAAAILTAGTVLTAIIALKTAIYLSRFNY